METTTPTTNENDSPDYHFYRHNSSGSSRSLSPARPGSSRRHHHFHQSDETDHELLLLPSPLQNSSSIDQETVITAALTLSTTESSPERDTSYLLSSPLNSTTTTTITPTSMTNHSTGLSPYYYYNDDDELDPARMDVSPLPLLNANNSSDALGLDMNEINNNTLIAAPDDDDEVSDSSSSSDGGTNLMLVDPEDMKYSLTSNLLFFIGASIQTYVAIWDAMEATADGAAEDDDHDDDGTGDSSSTGVYAILNSLGPFLFIVNALVDTQSALILPRQPSSPTREDPEIVAELPPSTLPILQALPLMWKQISPMSPSVLSPSSSTVSLERSLLMVHAETDIVDKLCDLAIALTFGIGAILEFYSTFFDFDNNDNDDDGGHVPQLQHQSQYHQHPSFFFLKGYVINMVSMHTYLISGLLTVQKDWDLIRHPGGSAVRWLLGVGMILFVMGSVLDCIISYLYDPELVSDNIISEQVLARCNLASTVLWNFNAVFYVWADCLLFSVPSKLKRCCRGVWLRIRQHVKCDMIMEPPGFLVELPTTMSLPFLVPSTSSRTTKCHHTV